MFPLASFRAGFFVLRTALLPFRELEDWSAALAAPSAAGDGALEEALSSDRASLRAALMAAFDRPEIREALFLASPSLDRALYEWRRHPDSKRGRRTERTLARYLQRMAGRATPFGLFAGCSLGTVGEQTRLSLAGRPTYRRHSRLDMDCLSALCAALGVEPPLVTGPEPLLDLLARSAACPAAASLQDVARDLGALDARGVGASPEDYSAIAFQLAAAMPERVDSQPLFQVDLIKPEGRFELGPAVLQELEWGCQLLRLLAPSPEKSGLQAFREAFLERYGEGREVPLAEALDGQAGIGFEPEAASPWATQERRVSWDRRCQTLLATIERSLTSGAREVELGLADVFGLANPSPPAFSSSLAVTASLAARSEEDLDQGEFQILLHHASGPPGVRRLGRLCRVYPELQHQIELHLRAEEALDPGAVHAEIVHLPQGSRVGNLICRPALRDYEIPCGGRSGVPADRQIPVSDLRVTVVDRCILLRSARLGRAVIPRLTAAHDFDRAECRIYRFLCKLQNQGAARFLSWSWEPFTCLSFLPRVRAGRLVLSRARWRIPGEEIAGVSRMGEAERFRAVRRWRADRGLPRLVVFAEGDRELPVDLDNALSVDSFLDVTRHLPEAILLERFPLPEELAARGPEGRFVHELLVPFLVQDSARAATPRVRSQPVPDAVRRFPPGSEWLYAKLYTSPNAADGILRDWLAPLRSWALESGLSDGWFFLRYADPGWHLRIRFHGPAGRLWGELLPRLNASAAEFLAAGMISRLQLDTYEREVERYGGPAAIAAAERVFQADSEAVLGILGNLPQADEETRWRLALVGADRLLGDFGLALPARLDLIRRLRGPEAHSLGARYRRERPRLEALLEQPGFASAFFDRRSADLAEPVTVLRDLERSGRLAQSFDPLLRSFLHMHFNRVFPAAPNLHEPVIYQFLARLYESRIARLPPGACR